MKKLLLIVFALFCAVVLHAEELPYKTKVKRLVDAPAYRECFGSPKVRTIRIGYTKNNYYLERDYFDHKGMRFAEICEQYKDRRLIRRDTLYFDDAGKVLYYHGTDITNNTVVHLNRFSRPYENSEAWKKRIYQISYQGRIENLMASYDHLDDAGNWIYAFTKTAHNDVYLIRKFDYKRVNESLLRRRNALNERIVAAEKKKAENETAGELGIILIFSVMLLLVVSLIVFVFKKVKSMKWRYILQLVVLFLTTPLVSSLSALAGSGYFWILPSALGIAFYFWWYKKCAPRVMNDMLFNRDLHNAFISAWFFMANVYIAFVVGPVVVPIPILGHIVGAYAGLACYFNMVLKLDSRCAVCHAYANVHFDGRFRDGVKAFHDHDHNRSTETDELSDGYDKTITDVWTHTISYHQMYRNEYTCGECGHHWKVSKKGEQLWKERRVKTRVVKEKYR